MRMLLHRGRHIVVADLPEDTDALDEGGTIEVAGRVGISASVEGVARRGRAPTYAKPVPVADLELLDHASLDQATLDKAAALLLTDDEPPVADLTATDPAE